MDFAVSLELRMFSHEFQSALLLVNVVLMQTWKFVRKYSHGNLTAKVLSLESFVLYGSPTLLFTEVVIGIQTCKHVGLMHKY